jgi:quercetin dioxygenase-like cupin family protein
LAIVANYELQPFDENDPDDFRPYSHWALLVDRVDGDRAHVDDITVIVEQIAPGDRIPLHEHPTSEVIVVIDGSPEVTLGAETHTVGPGAVVFIPARTAHGTSNTSGQSVRIHAMFPTERIGIRYLERNPAPGTEGDEPQPEFTIDVRSIVEGRA